MADEPEEPDDDSVDPEDESSEEEDEDSDEDDEDSDEGETEESPEEETEEPADEDVSGETEISALAELALCENLSQTSGWAARWSASMTGADGTLLWAPDTVHPLFLCIGVHGNGLEKILRRSIPREVGLAHDLVRDRSAIALDHDEIFSTQDPFLRGLPKSTKVCLAVPLEAEGLVVGLLALLFEHTTDTDATLERLEAFLHHAAPALGRALRSERKTVGMLHAIERLTNLYDLSKAFGSTIDTDELAALVVRKAADFATAEVASLWLLDSDEGEVSLAGTAVNDNYEIEAPEHVGASIIGDVVADQAAVRRNRIPESDPAATESEGYTLKSILVVPLIEDEACIGALALANKRGRHPEFTAEDEELLQDLCRQAVRALRTARQHEAEKKVEELDALLAVSREITSTLDLDKVMKSIVNATSALIEYDRCGIAIQQKGKLQLGALSGADEVNRKDPDAVRMEQLLQWVFLSGSDTSVTQDEEGEIIADRPETEEKFRTVFQETGMRSFFGVVLKDEEGKLGALAFESKEPLSFDEETKDLLSILVNQATVAVRNAQLYQQVPLAGFWKPLLEKRRKLTGIPKARRRAWAIGAAHRRDHPVRRSLAAAGRGSRPRAARPAGRGDVARGRGRGQRLAARGRHGQGRRDDRDAQGRVLRGRSRGRGDVGRPRPERHRAGAGERRRGRRLRRPVATGRSASPESTRAGPALPHAPDRPRLRHHRDGPHRGTRRTAASAGRGVLRGRRPPKRDRRGRHPRGGCFARPHRREDDPQVQPLSRAHLPWLRRAGRGAGSARGRGTLRDRRGPHRELRWAAQDRHARNRKSPRRHLPGGHSHLSQARAVSLDQDLALASVSIVSQRSRLIAAARPEEGAAALAARFGAPSERPALRQDLVIRRLVQMGEVVYIFKNARANAYYNFDEGDMVLIRLFDGTRTRHQILDAYQAEFPNETVEMSVVLEYHEMLRKYDLLEQSSTEQHLATLAGLKTARQRAAQQKAEGFDIFFLLFHVLDPDKFLNRTAKYVRWLWSPLAVAVGLLCFGWAFGVISLHWAVIWGGTMELYAFLRHPLLDVIQFFFILTMIGCVHEFAHAYVTKFYGGEVHDIGLALLYFTPAFYCDTTDSILFENKWHGLWVTLAGIYIEAWMCFFAVVLWVVSYPDTLLNELAFKTILFTGVSSVFFNINPLIKIDGYHALSSVLEMPELREESFRYIGASLQRHVLRLPVEVPEASRRKRRIYWIYGLLALAYVGVIMAFIGGLFFNLYHKYFPNFAIALLVVTMYRMFRKRVRLVTRTCRLVYLDKKEILMSPRARKPMLVAAAVLAFLVFVPWGRRSIDSPIVLKPRTTVRLEAPEDAIVSEVLKREGDAVRAGEPVFQLAKPGCRRAVCAPRDRT